MSKLERGKKPFPWRCSRCREKAVFSAVVSYSVDIGHDGRMYHIKLHRLKAPKCKQCGQVAPDSEANEQITRAFLKHAKLLMPEQIQGNRVALNLSQKQLASALGVAEETVSYWEDGIQIQTRLLDKLLRLFFGLPDARDLLTKRKLNKVGLVLGRRKALAST